MRRIRLFIKRCIDIMISGLCIIMISPVWLVIFVLMKVTMPGALFFKQERVGKNFKPFTILKFRTMRTDEDAEKNFKFEKDMERITPLGKVLRRTKLDETPQLINILKGEMSIVGPRPTVPQRTQEFREGQEIRLRMAPGLTGISQVSGNVLLSWERRIYYDCKYVEEFCLWLDLKIIIKTIGVVLGGEERYISEYDLKHHRNPFYDATHVSGSR
ncbi:MAG: sugar transferase [Lachnospiraceae bacterium]|nr:sugar transferase [Lachnospiraceae bacterium]